MDGKEKKFYRELKRAVKKKGNKRRRNKLKRDLRENPSEAHWSEENFGHNSSEWLNGIDNATEIDT